jgi:hypothetical protein
MRGSTGILSAAILALTMTTVTEAKEGRRNNGATDGTSTAHSANAPLSDNPVKRTWDFTKRFGIPRFDNRDCTSDAAALAAFVADYNQRVDAFLAGPTDPKKLGLERKNYVKQVLGTERDIATYLGTFEETGMRSPEGFVPPLQDDLCRAQAHRNSLIAIREGLKAISRVYPDMAEVAPRLAQANAAIARIGDEKAIQKFVGANRAATLATVRMKPALANNPAWENGLREGFARLKPGETILKLNLYSANWYVHKNDLTSYPEYRQIGAWVATKRSDGSCWINGIDLWQNYVGNGFDSGEYKLGQAPRQILCENV